MILIGLCVYCYCLLLVGLKVGLLDLRRWEGWVFLVWILRHEFIGELGLVCRY